VTRSGIDLASWYGGPDPGRPPYTRGISGVPYRQAPWVMGQYAGFGSADEANARYRMLLDQGATGFSVALDLPTQMGYDSDHPLADGEVGRAGVAIDSLEDMERLFAGIALERVREIRTTANGIGHLWMALVIAFCRRRGVDPASIRLFIQNDVLKEYSARGTYLYPPDAGLRISVDVMEYCARHFPHWTPLAVSGYHIREAGADAVQELAFSFSNAVAYLEAIRERGVDPDVVARSLFAFLSSGTDVLEEVAKFRSARRVWADLIPAVLGTTEPESAALRIFAFTTGSELYAAEPYNNTVRITLEALAAIFGGVQTLNTSAYDEALSTPSPEAATLALRTQQILLEESGVGDVVDPLGGSHAVEWLTDEIAGRVRLTMQEIEERGGALACIENGWFRAELADGAYRQQQELERGDRRVVGVNAHVNQSSSITVDAFAPDLGSSQAAQIERVRELRARRDPGPVDAALERLESAARSGTNLIEPTLAAVESLATVGEISARLKGVFGAYDARI
jgi:methylmalonyl-CoA mutase N-terminal domain/subunit